MVPFSFFSENFVKIQPISEVEIKAVLNSTQQYLPEYLNYLYQAREIDAFSHSSFGNQVRLKFLPPHNSSNFDFQIEIPQAWQITPSPVVTTRDFSTSEPTRSSDGPKPTSGPKNSETQAQETTENNWISYLLSMFTLQNTSSEASPDSTPKPPELTPEQKYNLEKLSKVTTQQALEYYFTCNPNSTKICHQNAISTSSKKYQYIKFISAYFLPTIDTGTCCGDKVFIRQIPCTLDLFNHLNKVNRQDPNPNYTSNYFNKLQGDHFGTVFVSSLFLGLLAVDRFMLGYKFLGILKIVTLGGFGVWWIFDLVLLMFGYLLPEGRNNWNPFV